MQYTPGGSVASEFYRVRGRVVPEEAGMEVKSSG